MSVRGEAQDVNAEKSLAEVASTGIDNSLLVEVTQMAVRQTLAEQEGVPYDPEGRSGKSVQNHLYEAVRELSRHLYLFNVPHEVWCDRRGEEPYWWVVSNRDAEDGFQWHCQVAEHPRGTDRTSCIEVSSYPPDGVNVRDSAVGVAHPFENDPDWWWVSSRK